MNSLKWILLFFLCCNTVYGQHTVNHITVEETSKSVRSNYYKSIKDSLGREWFISNKTIDCRIGTSWYQFDPDTLGEITTLVATSDNSVWFNTNTHVYRINHNRELIVYHDEFKTDPDSSLLSLNLQIQHDTVVVIPTYLYGNDTLCFSAHFFSENSWTEKILGRGEFITMETNGRVWFLSDTTLIEFTKNTHSKYALNTSKKVTFDLRTSTGEVWLHTTTSKIRIESETHFHEYVTVEDNNNLVHDINLAHGNVIEDDAGIIWTAITENKLASFNGVSWEVFTSSKTIGNELMFALGKVVFHYINRLFAWENPVMTVHSIGMNPTFFFDHKNKTVFAKNNSKHGRLHKLTSWTNWKDQLDTLPGLIPDISGFELFFENGDPIMRNSYNSVSYRYNGTEWVLNPVAAPNGLSSNIVYKIHNDPSSNTWFATKTGVSMLIDNTEWYNIPYEGYFQFYDTVFSIASDGDRKLWLGTSKGLHEYDGIFGTWKVYNATTALGCDTVYEVMVDMADRIWLSTPIGKFRCRQNTQLDTLEFTHFDTSPQFKQKTVFASTSYNEVYTITSTPTTTVLSKYNDNNTWTNKTMLFDQAPTGTFRTITAGTDHQLWVKFASSNEQASVYKVENNTFKSQVQIGTGLSNICFDDHNTRWEWYSHHSLIKSNNDSINIPISRERPCMTIARDNSIWITDGSSGVYQVTFNETIDTDEPVVGNTERQIILYPVPATSELFIDADIDQYTSIRIINTLGIEVLQLPYTRGSGIDVSFLPKGIYQLRVMSGDKSFIKSFSKE